MEITSIIGVPPREDHTGGGGVMVNRREYKSEEKACQSKSLGGNLVKNRSVYLPVKIG
jgi:hypothetical protein